MPDLETLRGRVGKGQSKHGGSLIVLYDGQGKRIDGGNDVQSALPLLPSKDDQRQLLAAVFNQPMPDGSLPGVYVLPTDEEPSGLGQLLAGSIVSNAGSRGRNRGRGRNWCFTLKGRLT